MRKILLIIMTLFICIGCTNKANENKNENVITFVDDLGREVRVSNPQRVATLLGSFADMWVLAGGSVIASADDAWADFNLDMPENAINLGHTKKLNLEQLFVAEPDFVIASTNTKIDLEWQETLEKVGIATAYFDVNDFDDYLRVLNICTDITNRKDLYEQNGLSIQKKIIEVIEKSKERIEKNGAPKVLSLRASASSVRAKNSHGNVLGEMLADLGCINIADNNQNLLENLSLEYILQEDPDYIFIVQLGDNLENVNENINKFIQENPAWQQLSAVKEGKVYIMEKTLYNLKPNEKWAIAYEKLEGILNDEK